MCCCERAVGIDGPLGSVATHGAIPVCPQREIWIVALIPALINTLPWVSPSPGAFSQGSWASFSRNFLLSLPYLCFCSEFSSSRGKKVLSELLVEHRLLWRAVPWNSWEMQSART